MGSVIEDAPAGGVLERIPEQSENRFAKLIPHQQIAIVPSFTLESGAVLRNVPVAFTVRGRLSSGRDNALVVCHALTGSADVADWWGPLMGGNGQAFDASRFYIVCLNSLGSPYGSASPVTNKDGDPSRGSYGPEFPLTTIRDDVRIHKVILDDLGIRQVAAVVGGSMGGMLTLEWAYLGKDYIRCIVPIATSARHSAWGISWGEAQRQSIYSDPNYEDGYYNTDEPPSAGLGAARMSALLTYRSRDSFESRFGRNTPDHSKQQSINGVPRPATPSHDHWSIHNDGHTSARGCRTPPTPATPSSGKRSNPLESIGKPEPSMAIYTDPHFSGTTEFSVPTPKRESFAPTSHYFSAQSYLRYQGKKFVGRFDSNCYIAITRKLDSHDVSRNRADSLSAALAQIQQPTLVLGIESDGLFTFAEQQELADGIPNSQLGKIDSPEGHDAFLLQFEQVNKHLLDFFRKYLPDIMSAHPLNPQNGAEDGVGAVTQNSTFGEAEVAELTNW